MASFQISYRLNPLRRTFTKKLALHTVYVPSDGALECNSERERASLNRNQRNEVKHGTGYWTPLVCCSRRWPDQPATAGRVPVAGSGGGLQLRQRLRWTQLRLRLHRTRWSQRVVGLFVVVGERPPTVPQTGTVSWRSTPFFLQKKWLNESFRRG